MSTAGQEEANTKEVMSQFFLKFTLEMYNDF